MLALAEATFAAGDIEGARRRYAQAAASARRDGDADAHGRAPRSGSRRCSPYGAVDQEGVALLTQALERLPTDDGALRARATRPARGLRARPGAARGADRRGAGDGPPAARRGHARLAVPDAAGRRMAPRARRRARARRPRSSCASRPSTPTTARSCGPTCTGSATRCRPATSPAPTPTSTARARSPRATRRTHHRWFLMVYEAGRAAFAGPPGRGRAAQRGGARAQPPHGEDCYQEYTVHRLVLAAPALAPARRRRRRAARVRRPLPAAAGVGGDARVARVGARGRRGGAAQRRDLRATTTSPRSSAHRTSCPPPLCLAEAVAGAGEPHEVERLYELLLPYAAANPVLINLWALWGPVARGLGLLAAADDRPRGRRGALRRGAAAGRGVGRAGVGAAHDRRLAGDRRPGPGPRARSSTTGCARARARAPGRRGADRRRGHLASQIITP